MEKVSMSLSRAGGVKVTKSTDALPEEFTRRLRELEESYLSQDDPIRQSGYGGGEVRWRDERGVILEAVDRDGDFLDVGCANGYLLECLVAWARERGVTLTPYGVDIGAKLIGLAKARFPEQSSHFWAANAWEWAPPRRFGYVYSLCDCVPESHLTEYLRRLQSRYVEEGGTLILGAYGRPEWELDAQLRRRGFTPSGTAVRGPRTATQIAWMKMP